MGFRVLTGSRFYMLDSGLRGTLRREFETLAPVLLGRSRLVERRLSYGKGICLEAFKDRHKLGDLLGGKEPVRALRSDVRERGLVQ